MTFCLWLFPFGGKPLVLRAPGTLRLHSVMLLHPQVYSAVSGATEDWVMLRKPKCILARGTHAASRQPPRRFPRVLTKAAVSLHK